ncbi:hypothetical protein HNQ53_001975 [Microbulbifer hydrolyticus]|uniref:Uncharacterized protein n=1 Tax=Microbulbifer hydrolyticus TaxID=48074 RepID=A0AA89PVL9_9GAMM|nr:hypothetical protein [Microbulbifer hydrolyticus]
MPERPQRRASNAPPNLNNTCSPPKPQELPTAIHKVIQIDHLSKFATQQIIPKTHRFMHSYGRIRLKVRHCGQTTG